MAWGRTTIAAAAMAVGCTASDDAGGSGDATGSVAESDTQSMETASTGMELPLVEVRTSMGNLLFELRPDVAPATVANFVAYIDSGFYDGSDGLGATILHRVVPTFVVQGGGLTPELAAKTTMPAIASEAGGLENVRGAVSMALAAGDVDSATSQFFINVTDNPELDVAPAFTVFATVALGMDLVDTLSLAETMDVPPYEGVPVDTVVIESVSVL